MWLFIGYALSTTSRTGHPARCISALIEPGFVALTGTISTYLVERWLNNNCCPCTSWKLTRVIRPIIYMLAVKEGQFQSIPQRLMLYEADIEGYCTCESTPEHGVIRIKHHAAPRSLWKRIVRTCIPVVCAIVLYDLPSIWEYRCRDQGRSKDGVSTHLVPLP